MKLQRLNVNFELFNQLSSYTPPWWQSLVADPEIIIEIRKNNIIDGYYNGGCIMKDLSYQNNQYRASIHFEYICLQSKNPYVDYALTENTSELNISPRQYHFIAKTEPHSREIRATFSAVRPSF